MPNNVEIRIGDQLEMRKAHPCGCKVWQVMRVGMDFRLRCMGCQRELMLPRSKAIRATRRVIRGNQVIVL